MAPRVFYVYEHWRPDLDLCFWVGKGKGDRAYRFHRNFHYNNVVKKLARAGLCVEVRLVRGEMSEASALDLERARIAFWRSAGVALTNYTDGGEGVSGLKHSAATRAVIREKHKNQKIRHSPETRAKIGRANSVALAGRKNPVHGDKMRGRKLSPEHRAKISAGMIGRPVSPETIEKIRASNLGQTRTAQARENMRVAHLGKKTPLAVRRKMSEAQKRAWVLRKENA